MTAESTPPESENGGRILVIDDEPVIAENIAKMLRSANYEVETATSGSMGIELFQRHVHDLVLTDLRLGDMAGTDVLAAVRKVSSTASVVIITGYATTESAVEAMRLGANDYLTKPVRMSELLLAVRSQLASVRLQARVKSLNRAIELERDKLRRSVTELTLLKRLAERMMSTLNYTEGFDLILTMLTEEVEADVAAIYNLARHSVRFSATAAPTKRTLLQVCNLFNEQAPKMMGVNVNCDLSVIEGITADLAASQSRLVSSVVLPIMQEDRPFGMIVVGSTNNEEFAEMWGDFARRLSEEASEFLGRVKRSVEQQRLSTSAVVEHTQDGIVMIQTDDNSVLMNPMARSILNLPSGKAPDARTICGILHLKLDEIVENLKKHTSNEGKRTTTVSSEIHSQGKATFVRTSVSLLPSVNQRYNTLLLVIHDVTKERQVDEIKSRIISNISHELRTPTAVIKEFISLIIDGIAGPLSDGQRQYMTIIKSNVERLARLIENLLTLARSDTGGFSVVLQAMELGPVINNVVNSMMIKLRKKQMSISTSLPSEIPAVFADSDAVTQILTNLVENAYKYSDENTEVSITVKALGARVEISVKDQGYGIPEEDKENIFKRFHRLVDENDPKFQEGVGLGLAVVRDLVSRQGGDIWVVSKVGEGSTFTFTLQVARESEEVKPA